MVLHRLAGHTDGGHITDASQGRVVPKAAQGRQSPEAALRQLGVLTARHGLEERARRGFRAAWMPAPVAQLWPAVTVSSGM